MIDKSKITKQEFHDWHLKRRQQVHNCYTDKAIERIFAWVGKYLREKK